MNKEEIKELMEFFDETNLTRLRINRGDFKIEFEKNYNQSSNTIASINMMPTESVATPQDKTKNAVENSPSIKSPMVGTFYQAPSPGSKPFVEKGDIIKKGHTVAIIEAMKIMNELEADFDCKIIEVLVSDGQPVEYDMPLFLVEKV